MNVRAISCRALMGGVLLLVLSACSEQSLYSGLSEREANEMVSVLASSGLESRKERDNDDLFSVSTGADDFAAAVRTLSANGLPHQRYDTLGEVFAKEGFVSSPLEERARLNHALSQEIASTLSSIDGVLMARVHLAVPQRDELSNTRTASSASVFVKHRKGVKLEDKVSKIKALVVNGIENLPYDNVTVALFESGSAPQRLEAMPVQQSLQAQGAGAWMSTGDGSQPVKARLSSLVPAEILTSRFSVVAGLFLILLSLVYLAIRHFRGKSVFRKSVNSQANSVAGVDSSR